MLPSRVNFKRVLVTSEFVGWSVRQVMLGFLVGNDFVPHLPNLHIREDALPTVYRCYKQVLPTLDGERGTP